MVKNLIWKWFSFSFDFMMLFFFPFSMWRLTQPVTPTYNQLPPPPPPSRSRRVRISGFFLSIRFPSFCLSLLLKIEFSKIIRIDRHQVPPGFLSLYFFTTSQPTDIRLCVTLQHSRLLFSWLPATSSSWYCLITHKLSILLCSQVGLCKNKSHIAFFLPSFSTDANVLIAVSISYVFISFSFVDRNILLISFSGGNAS